MDSRILEKLWTVTPEEQAILDRRQTIDRELYMLSQKNVINSQKLLAVGKLITLRTHTRFIHFPEHTHDYIELVYMCQGQTSHIVNGTVVTLHCGELLFLSQSARHEVCEAGEGDIAVNFIVLPDFSPPLLPPSARRRPPCGAFWWTVSAGRITGRDICFSGCRMSNRCRIWWKIFCLFFCRAG